MHLAKLRISNFRKISDATLQFQPGLNILVGANNVGKTAVIDALRALLGGQDDAYPRFGAEDVHQPRGGQAAGDIFFEYVFKGMTAEDEADFHHGFTPAVDGNHEVKISVRYSSLDNGG